MKILLASACALAVAACSAHVPMNSVAAPRHELADAVQHVPAFVVLPAADFRSAAERSGQGLEASFVMAAAGGAMGHHAGAATLAANELAWGYSPYPSRPVSAATGVAADMGRALEEATARPVRFVDGAAEAIAASAPDGTIVVQIVIDHLTRVMPQNHDFSQTKTQEGNYEVTRTSTSTSTFGPFWVVSFRVQLAEVRGGRIARRQVRYVSPAASGESAYAESVHVAADEIVRAVVNRWGGARPDVVARGGQ